MFEKLLANLPYNPGLVRQMGFYAGRMRREAAIRRTGMVFIVLAFVVQFFAVVSPPQPSVAASTNDLINGGFSSVAELTADCKANDQGYAYILKYYGITCDDLAYGKTVSLVSTAAGGHLFSMGRNPLPPINPVTKKPTDDTPVNNIPGVAQPLYWRYLWSWDTGTSSTYQAVEVKSTYTGQTFYILYNCGNLVHVDIPVPYTPPKPPAPAPKPAPCPYAKNVAANSPQCKPCSQSLSSSDTQACLVYSKTASDPTQGFTDANGHTAKAGDTIIYTLSVKNYGLGTVKGFILSDNFSYVLDYAAIVSDQGAKVDSGDVLLWQAVNIAPGATFSRQVVVKVDDPIPQTPPSSSDPMLFNHIISNTYGNSINIFLPQTIVTAVETTNTQLPNTGPGTSIMIVAAVVVIAGYFLARSRLLALESGLAIQRNNGGNV